MPFVPVVAAQSRPSRRAKELAAALIKLCDEYQQREGTLKGAELQMAFSLAEQQLKKRQGGGNAPAQIVAIVLAALVLMAGLVLMLTLR